MTTQEARAAELQSRMEEALQIGAPRQRATLNLSYAGPGRVAVEVTHDAATDLTINAAAPPAPRPRTRWQAFKDGWRIGAQR